MVMAIAGALPFSCSSGVATDPPDRLRQFDAGAHQAPDAEFDAGAPFDAGSLDAGPSIAAGGLGDGGALDGGQSVDAGPFDGGPTGDAEHDGGDDDERGDGGRDSGG